MQNCRAWFQRTHLPSTANPKAQGTLHKRGPERLQEPDQRVCTEAVSFLNSISYTHKVSPKRLPKCELSYHWGTIHPFFVNIY